MAGVKKKTVIEKKAAAVLPGRGGVVRGRGVAFLRGVNLAAHKRMKMADLVSVFEKSGCKEIATYIQSGNVVFTAPAAGIAAAALEAAIETRFGFQAPVVLRSAEELEAAIARTPYAGCDPEKDRPHISFLAEKPSAECVALLDPQRSPGDSFAVVGRELYLLFPTGIANNKLTSQYFDSRLKTTGTARNWRTVLAVAEMLRVVK
jgi:uncharacterized protein (DUF1697 family)